MGSTKVLEVNESIETVPEFIPSQVKAEVIDLVRSIEGLSEDSYMSEEGNDILSIYRRQIKGYSFISAEEEKDLCKELDRRKREIVETVGFFIERVKHLANPQDKTTRTSRKDLPRGHSLLSRVGRGRSQIKGLIVQLERIDALRMEMELVKNTLRKRTGEASQLQMWREAKGRGEVEISKLIARVRLNGEIIEELLSHLGREILQKDESRERWEHAEKDLRRALEEISVHLQEIRVRKNKLIYPHLILVPHIARRYQNRGVDEVDLIQEGNRGLMRAVDTFDYRRGNRFVSYAIWWIKQAMIRAIHNYSRTVRIPVYLFDRASLFLSVSEQMSQEKGEEPTPAELAGRMKVSKDDIHEIMRIFNRTLSLEEYMQPEGNNKEGTGTDESLWGEVMQSDLRRKVDDLLSHLSPREEEVLRLRYGMNRIQDPHSLQQVGKKFNLSRERIRQIERAALIKLRKMRQIQELRDFLS